MLTSVEFNLFLPSEELMDKWEANDFNRDFDLSEAFVSIQEFKEIEGIYQADLNANLWFEDSNLKVIDPHKAHSIYFKMENGNYDDLLRIKNELYGFTKECNGVCDNYNQILEHYPELLTSENKYFVLMTPISKEHQPINDGWRWSKWGEYIGSQRSMCEYLADEPEIDLVYVYKIYTLAE